MQLVIWETGMRDLRLRNLVSQIKKEIKLKSYYPHFTSMLPKQHVCEYAQRTVYLVITLNSNLMNSTNLKPLWGLLCLLFIHSSAIFCQTIFGTIANVNDEPMEGVVVTLSCASGFVTETNAAGIFVFEGIPEGSACELSVSMNGDVLNGVSTFDLLLISKHILGQAPFNSPYQLIAADVDHNGIITEADLLDLQTVFTGMEEGFPSNTSWRFVDADYIFTDPGNPGEYPEVVNIGKLQGNVEINYIAIKIGDVNGSAVPN